MPNKSPTLSPQDHFWQQLGLLSVRIDLLVRKSPFEGDFLGELEDIKKELETLKKSLFFNKPDFALQLAEILWILRALEALAYHLQALAPEKIRATVLKNLEQISAAWRDNKTWDLFPDQL